VIKMVINLNALRWSAVMVLLLSCLACTPEFDWRSSRISHQGDQFTLTFPGKALSAQKTVVLAGQSEVLQLSAVQIGRVQFALGSVPAKSAAHAQVLASALAMGFAANLQLNEEQTKRTAVTLARSSGAFDVTYPATRERTAQARFVWTQHAAYELLVIGPANELPPEVADTFIRSMKFE
jgi:hypothetical protein